ncbi:MAG: hypothetical protein WKF75_21145, partial [Singulisphaera sp.]
MAEAQPQAGATAEAGVAETSQFESLLTREFKPKSDSQKEAINNAVRTLAEQALADTALISVDAVHSIES